MATRDKLMKLLQEMRGLSEMGRPQMPAKSSPLFLAQLRSHMNATSRPRRRLFIASDIQEAHGFPEPVEIIHLKTDSGV
jgi:hypothetical protein